jgi:DNA-binding transcriptional LysR family regulator
MELTYALRTFARIIERGSLTAAARDLGISQPAVSKLLVKLETHTGSRLLERSARAIRPTTDGLRLYQASGAALQAIDEAIDSVQRGRVGHVGRLRLHAPSCLGERHLATIAMAFQAKHAGVSIDLSLHNSPVDLIHEDVDLAFQLGRPLNRNVVAKRIGSSRRILVAAPAFIAKYGPFDTVKSLLGAAMIVTDASLSQAGTLTLISGRTNASLAVKPMLRTNSASVLIDAVRSGRGVGTAQMLLVADQLNQGSLVRILPRFEIEPSDLYLTYSSSRFLRPLVRSFIDYSLPLIRKIEGITR